MSRKELFESAFGIRLMAVLVQNPPPSLPGSAGS